MLAQRSPIKIGVIGLTHTHVHWIFNSEKDGHFTIEGIVEPNRKLARQYAEQYGFPMQKVFNSPSELLANVTIEAVTAFGTIYEHLEVVETFAPKGIHVMVEKPLAVSMKHAKQMKKLAEANDIFLLTNYETTWYPTNHRAYDMIYEEDKIGDIRKIIIRDGHKGPKKIGVNNEFLEWLTDPIQNGGGAITDFGCYGANLSTWIMKGKRPNQVTARTMQLQPENNPAVDDEAMIILEYDQVAVIIQGSWNWPIGRKDMEIYGLNGAIYADNRNDLRVRTSKGYDGFDEVSITLEELTSPLNDPFAYFVAVIKKDLAMGPFALSTLENNMIVVEILEAAKKSAKSGKSIRLK